MSLHDGVTLLEGGFIVLLAVVAVAIARHLIQDEKAKIEAVRAKKKAEGKLG